MRPRSWEVAAFALAFAISGLVTLALAWSGDDPYVDIMRSAGSDTFVFRRAADGATLTQDLGSLLDFHRGWVAYVTGRSAGVSSRHVEWFTDEERSHMADVRGVFIGAQAAAVAAAGVLAWLFARATRRESGRALVRRSAIAALAGVAVIAGLAVVAFDALFLALHQVFFPQGNFLFPADSNLLALYPEPYWYGITLRIGVSFVALAMALALAAQLPLRRSSSR